MIATLALRGKLAAVAIIAIVAIIAVGGAIDTIIAIFEQGFSMIWRRVDYFCIDTRG